jgi:N-acetylglutamate synthase-like GNAT family acetyltransferase
LADYLIRPATENDAETIKRMVQSAPLNPNAIDWQHFLVLEILEEEMPKIASIGMAYPVGDFYELDSVVTEPSERRHGYAEAVVRALVERTPHPIYLLAETDLIHYYERLGFKLIAREAAPQEMIEQVEWLDEAFGKYVRYSIMGLLV